MSTTTTLFDFDLLLAQADREGYYFTRWDQATPITVRAATKQQAINSAAAALGEPRRGRYWVARTIKVTAAAVADESAVSA
jgi:hypothetical protein